jgi:uncharacterized protein YegP (UPF0339 family)
MTDQREILKAQRARCEERVCCLKSYVKELTDMADRHGTGSEQFEEELSKARSDIEYYEGQAAQAAEQLGDDGAARRTFQVYRDEGGEWRWRLVAGNGQIIAVSGEGYRERRDCLHGVELVKDSKEAAVEGGD